MTKLPGYFMENVQIFPALAPAADMFNTGPNSAPISMENFERLVFLVTVKSAGTNTGTAKLQLFAASSAASSNAAAVKFRYGKKTTGASDTWTGPIEVLAADGITTTANESTIYALEVDASDLPAGKPWVYLDTTEVVNDPVDGSAIALGLNHKYGFPFPTALS